MPYIKKSMRPVFNKMIEMIKDDSSTIFICIKDIHVEIDNLPLKQQDGCLNYMFTQLLRKVDAEIAETVMSLTIIEMFLNSKDISYYNISRAIALLENMSDEFVRRGWWTEDNPRSGFALKRMLNEVKKIRDKYEDNKIEENGDLD